MEIGLVGLLRTAWLAGTLPILVVSIPSSCINFIHQIMLTLAGRGKTGRPRSHRLNVPQKFFCHFYALAVVWTSFLLVSTWMYANRRGLLFSELTSHSNVASNLIGDSPIYSLYTTYSTSAVQEYRVWRSVFLLLLMELQVLRRLYESLYVFNYGTTAQMHIVGYLTGLFFYTAAPLSLCCNCASDVFKFVADHVAELIKGKDQTQTIELYSWELSWSQWIGAAVFLWGWIHQRRCHAILGKLREVGKERMGDYAIPHGDWFELVSSPHYLAEIVIYAGLVVASGGMDLTIWLLFGFVVANLVFAAAETHRWYHHKFEDYPTNRYAIIPYLQ